VLSSTYDGENIYLSWEIKDGYYMYLKSIELKNNNELISYNIFDSKIELHEDEFFGETQILKKKFNIKADLNYILNLSDVFIYYQGCSESGFCYPLQKNKLF
jgi:thiol:disulfide interchange protein DsbD